MPAEPNSASLCWVPIRGGSLTLGSDEYYPEEAPPFEHVIPPFSLTATPITNAQFAEFVRSTGYLTLAEHPLSAQLYPELEVTARRPGSLVFRQTSGPVDLRDWQQWWSWVPGACWRTPQGPGSSLDGFEHHPVVHVAFEDACQYATWAGGRLPTEAEFEFAANGGINAGRYAWGDEREPHGTIMANTWRGHFPHQNDGADGWRGTSPVASFPKNRLGLFDCIGNVWEWTSDRYVAFRHAPDHMIERVEARTETAATTSTDVGCGCTPTAGEATATRLLVATQHDDRVPVGQRVLKGGSHLCAPEYCLRYRPAARLPQDEDTATTHIGFRVAKSLA